MTAVVEDSSEVRGLDEDEDDVDIKTDSDTTTAKQSSSSSSSAAAGAKAAATSSSTVDSPMLSSSLASASAGLRLSDVITCAQEKGAKMYQEDSTCVLHSEDMTVLMAVVFDGHGGLNGQVASRCVCALTEEWFAAHWRECRGWAEDEWHRRLITHLCDAHEAIRDRFIELEKSRRKHARQPDGVVVDTKGIVRKFSKLPVHGGTTASVVVVIRKPDGNWRVVCANVGDSDCLLLARRPATLDRTHSKCTHLSVDHSPDSTVEFLRIKALPLSAFPKKLLFVYDQVDRSRKYECPLVFLEDGTKDPKFVKNPWGHRLRPTNVRYDPAVYAVSPCGVSHDVTCIAMTRSLGDFYAHQFGLSNEADVTVMDLKGDQEFIVTVGSDGIWDCWKWDDFSDYVNGEYTKQSGDLEAVCKTVLKFTVARAKACFGAGSFDDASLALVALSSSLYPPLEEEYKKSAASKAASSSSS